MPPKNGSHLGCFVAAFLPLALPAQSTKGIVGIHDLEHGLVHPTILPKLKERSRQLKGIDLALDPALPWQIKLVPGKRRLEFTIESEPKVGVTRLAVPGFLNAKLTYPSRREKSVRFELWEHQDSFWLTNHGASTITLAGYGLIFVDMDHDGLFGETVDAYVVKPPKAKSWTDADGRVQFHNQSAPLSIDGKQYWLQPDARGFTLQVSDREPDFAAKREEDYAAALRLVNGWRQQLGHAPLQLRDELSRGCEEHALYCATNGEMTHTQDPKKPGATPRGAKAGMASELVKATSMAGAVPMWCNSFFHRIHMLSPGLTEIGMGHMQGIAAFDTKTAFEAGKGGVWHWPIAGATDVPVSWSSGEQPSPIGTAEFPPAVASLWGYPITITFPTAAIAGVFATVMVGGIELPVLVTSPEQPSQPDFPTNLESILVMTRSPLPAGAKVEVRVRCQYQGKPWAKEWSFTTRPK